MLDNYIIQPSQSPYNASLWIVPKKDAPDGSKRYRLVIDYRALNDITVVSTYPLPQISDILDQLGGVK